MERIGPTGLSKANMLTALERESGKKALREASESIPIFADRAGNFWFKAASKLE